MSAWTPEPFKHVAAVTVTCDLSTTVSVDISIDDIPVEDAVAATEYLTEQIDALVTKRKPKRKSRRRKAPQPSPTEPVP